MKGVKTVNNNKNTLKARIGSKIRSIQQKHILNKKWNKPSGGQYKRGCFHKKNVSDEDFEEMKSLIERMKEVKTFSEYKPLFKKFCSLCMIPDNGCVLQKYQFTKGAERDQNEVLVLYTNTRHQIQIPSGYELYHKSEKTDLKELKPFFRGKEGKYAYLYSDPRVYLTVKKKLPNIFADVSGKKQMTTYKVKENIGTAYVDPLLPNSATGAVYVTTQFPIKVDKLTPEEVNKKDD